MANNIPFQPMGKTYQIQAPTANTAVTIAITADSPCQQYLLATHNDASKPCYVRVATSNVAAALPTANGSYCMLIPPTSRVVITGPQTGPNTTVWVSLISENNNAECYVTAGEGF